METARRKSWLRLERDLLIVTAAILAAIVLVESGMLDYFLSAVQEQYMLASFITGIFFTSAFTITPAAIVLVHIASEWQHPIIIALASGLGAMLGDAALFLFVRDVFAADLEYFLKARKMGRFIYYLRIGKFRWFAPVVGALIILSPLPDELGLTLLGFTRIPLWAVLGITFVLNSIGIYLLVILTAHL